MKKMSHKYLLCAGVVLSQLATGAAFAAGGGVAPNAFVSPLFETIHGKVLNPDGSPVVGVTVTVKGSKGAVATDAQGQFSIQAHKGDILVFSSIGYTTQQVRVGDGDVQVTLRESNKELNEVVVTALGIRKQSRVLGYSTTEVPGASFTDS